MKKYILIILLFFTANQIIFAQEYIEPEADEEFVIGINWHTFGGIIGGFHARYVRSAKKGIMNIFGIDAVHIKHPRESRSILITGKGTYLPNIENRFFVLRPHYGKEFILFAKGQDQGVQVSLITSGGPSIGFLAPYFVDYGDSTKSVKVQNSYQLNPNLIIGSDGIFERIGSAKIIGGIHLKSSLNLSFSPFGGNGAGLEVGIVSDIFNKKIFIAQEYSKKQVFVSVFATLYYSFR